jgi:hypothetical protein
MVGAAGALAGGDVVEVGEVLDEAAVWDCFAAQPARHAAETRATAIAVSERAGWTAIATSSLRRE